MAKKKAQPKRQRKARGGQGLSEIRKNNPGIQVLSVVPTNPGAVIIYTFPVSNDIPFDVRQN